MLVSWIGTSVLVILLCNSTTSQHVLGRAETLKTSQFLEKAFAVHAFDLQKFCSHHLVETKLKEKKSLVLTDFWEILTWMSIFPISHVVATVRTLGTGISPNANTIDNLPFDRSTTMKAAVQFQGHIVLKTSSSGEVMNLSNFWFLFSMRHSQSFRSLQLYSSCCE